MTKKRPSRLKVVRVVAASVFFVSTSLVLLDPTHAIPPSVVRVIIASQVFPALLKLASVGSGLAILVAIVQLAMAAAFGRVYCSTICPLGTLQDGILRVGGMIWRKRRFYFRQFPSSIQIGLGVLALSFVFLYGSALLIDLIEPYSDFARIVSSLGQPIVSAINNGVALILERAGISALYQIPFPSVAVPSLLGSVIIFASIAVLTVWRGRAFCNLLCPTGAILRLTSKVAPCRIRIDEKACNNCGACEKLCKAGCIDATTKFVDHQSCIGCFNCLAACPTSAVRYSIHHPHERQEPAASHWTSRRRVLASLIAPAVTLPIASRIEPRDTLAQAAKYLISHRQPISPPGSFGVSRFSELCTACHLCITACPTGVLVPSFLEYGLTGLFQPKMDYSADYCNYDCTICGSVCPTGAIVELEKEAKKLVQIGRSTFIKDDCIVVSKKKDCAACSEHCPTKAVHTVPYEGNLAIPDLDNDLCIGCGACEHSCPVSPRKAIYVTGNPIHQKAKKPTPADQQGKPSRPIFDSSKDFPF